MNRTFCCDNYGRAVSADVVINAESVRHDFRFVGFGLDVIDGAEDSLLRRGLLLSSAVLREEQIELIVITERHRIDSARITNAVIRAVFLLSIEGSISVHVVWEAEVKAPSASIPAIVYPKDFDFFVGVHDGPE